MKLSDYYIKYLISCIELGESELYKKCIENIHELNVIKIKVKVNDNHECVTEPVNINYKLKVAYSTVITDVKRALSDFIRKYYNDINFTDIPFELIYHNLADKTEIKRNIMEYRLQNNE